MPKRLPTFEQVYRRMMANLRVFAKVRALDRRLAKEVRRAAALQKDGKIPAARKALERADRLLRERERLGGPYRRR